MENQVALKIVSEALNIAIIKGNFGLIEVTNIVRALETLENKQVNTPFSIPVFELDEEESTKTS